MLIDQILSEPEGGVSMAFFINDNDDGTFDVIAGRKLDDEPLSRLDAERLARRELPSSLRPKARIGLGLEPWLNTGLRNLRKGGVR